VFKYLAELLETRKGEYVLFLGAGTSISYGKTTEELVRDIVSKVGLNPENPWDSFCHFLREIGSKKRYSILSRYFKGMRPSVGYKALAKLIERGYFRIILTTNFDFMLEEALKKTNLVMSKDYFICTYGAEKENSLRRKLEDESMIRIVKLHGDYSKRILPIAEKNTFTCGKELEKSLKKLTKESMIFVGYSKIDNDVLSCLTRRGKSLWWVNERKVTAEKTAGGKSIDTLDLNEEIYRILLSRGAHENSIWGEDGKSDIFFKKIYRETIKKNVDSDHDRFTFGVGVGKSLLEPPYQRSNGNKASDQHLESFPNRIPSLLRTIEGSWIYKVVVLVSLFLGIVAAILTISKIT